MIGDARAHTLHILHSKASAWKLLRHIVLDVVGDRLNIVVVPQRHNDAVIRRWEDKMTGTQARYTPNWDVGHQELAQKGTTGGCAHYAKANTER